MSALEAVPPLENRETERPPTVNERIGELADNMRAYDELVAQMRELNPQRTRLVSELIGVDLETALAEKSEAIALKALEQLVVQRKMDSLQSQVSKMGNPFKWQGESLKRRHQKLALESVDTEKHTLGKFEVTESGNLSGMGSTNKLKEGRLYDLSLDPSNGGCLQIKGRVWVYQASPLIDRENDYQPAFRVTEL